MFACYKYHPLLCLPTGVHMSSYDIGNGNENNFIAM